MISSFGPEFDSLHLHYYCNKGVFPHCCSFFFISHQISLPLRTQKEHPLPKFKMDPNHTKIDNKITEVNHLSNRGSETHEIPTRNNFDLLRFLFALFVFFAHYDFLNGTEFINCPFGAPQAVNGFFVISGLLIYRSYERTASTKKFFIKRARRIFPAYFLVVLLTPLLFSFFSTLSPKEYWQSVDLLKYLAANLSFMNFLHPDLPGVVSATAVNPSLWTIKIELAMYLTTPLLFLFVQKGGRKTMVILATLLALLSATLRWQADQTGIGSYDLLGKWILLAASYVGGVCLLLFHKELYRWRWILFAISLPLLFQHGFVADFMQPFCTSGVVFAIAFSMPLFNSFGKMGDPSYGLYLYHGPLVNLFICAGISVSAGAFGTLTTILLILSYLSWHLFEKRVLRRG